MQRIATNEENDIFNKLGDSQKEVDELNLHTVTYPIKDSIIIKMKIIVDSADLLQRELKNKLTDTGFSKVSRIIYNGGYYLKFN